MSLINLLITSPLLVVGLNMLPILFMLFIFPCIVLPISENLVIDGHSSGATNIDKPGTSRGRANTTDSPQAPTLDDTLATLVNVSTGNAHML